MDLEPTPRMADARSAREFLQRVGPHFFQGEEGQHRVTARKGMYAEDVTAHPYFPEMKVYVRQKAKQLILPGFKGIEVGAGGGNLTEALVTLPFGLLVVSDLDEEGFFVSRLQELFGKQPGVSVEKRDLLQPQEEHDFYDAVFSCAVDHHIPPEGKPQFLTNVRSMLKPGAYYISADVLLTDYALDDDNARLDAAALFHAAIIAQAIAKGLKGPAWISYQAWLNEVSSHDEYKVSPRLYRRYAEEAGFGVREMLKIGPSDSLEHGVYVNVLQRVE